MPESQQEELTGRSIVLFDEEAREKDFRDFLQALQTHGSGDPPFGEAWWSNLFKVAVVPYRPYGIQRRKVCDFGVLQIIPERVFRSPIVSATPSAYSAFDHLDAVYAKNSGYHGTNIRVAILDSGFEFGHPDFKTRKNITFQTFVGRNAQDENGHGTHCAGLACGPRKFSDGTPAYGIADDADMLIVRVADEYKATGEGLILKGLDHIAGKADIASVSLNAGSETNEPSALYERVGRILLLNSCLVIASAGDNGDYGTGPVQKPANSNAIMAIGSIGAGRAISSFSPGLIPGGDPIDFVAPGENIRSSWLSGEDYQIASGTSQAAPIVAGLAALWAQAKNLRGMELWNEMTKHTITVGDFPHSGYGLLVAP
jgi:subtilisin family serine protease